MSTDTQPSTAPYDFSRTQPFTMVGTPLLEGGRSSNMLALAPQMWVHAKVYAGGGERGLHCHPTEDHLFFVLAGRATFRDDNDQTTLVGPYSGIMIPRGVQYCFEAADDENLVILRVGAGASSDMKDGRIPVKRSTQAQRPERGTPIPGAVFDPPRS